MTRSKILVADDDQITLSLITKGLRDAGYDVIAASNGDQAVALGCAEHPDLAVLDIRMPGLFGIEAARQLRECAGIDSIYLSAYADKEVVELATKEGALGYLVKPVNSTQLIPAIEAALERSAELRRLHRNSASLTDAITRGREISVAIGVYMERFNISERQAFEALRSYARSHHLKLADVARQMTQGSRDERNRLIKQISRTAGGAAQPGEG